MISAMFPICEETQEGRDPGRQDCRFADFRTSIRFASPGGEGSEQTGEPPESPQLNMTPSAVCRI